MSMEYRSYAQCRRLWRRMREVELSFISCQLEEILYWKAIHIGGEYVWSVWIECPPVLSPINIKVYRGDKLSV